MECAPDAANEAVQVATPLASGTALHIAVAPSLNVTVPGATVGTTVAVSVTGWPMRLELCEEDNVVVVADCKTVNDRLTGCRLNVGGNR